MEKQLTSQLLMGCAWEKVSENFVLDRQRGEQIDVGH